MTIKDLREAIRLMSYSSEAKKSYIIAGLMLLLGMAATGSGDSGMGVSGAVIMLLAPHMLFQLYMRVNSIRVVLASPQSYRLQTTVMATFMTALQMVGFCLSVLAVVLLACLGAVEFDFVGKISLVLLSVALMCMIYSVFCYRFFIASTVCYVLAYLGLTILLNRNSEWFGAIQISWPIGLAVGLVCILLAWFPIRLIADVMVRYPMDYKAFGVAGRELSGQ